MTDQRPAPGANSVAGLLLAAGEGRRLGMPKVLLEDNDGRPLVDGAVRTLLDGGCSTVTVVLGAAADEAEDILRRCHWPEHDEVVVVRNDSWRSGMGSSLAAGLDSLDADAAVVMLVDLPDVPAAVIARLIALAAPETLARATYDGRPGHPVLIGRDHWPDVIRSAQGDRGARDYLDRHDVREVPCEDLATGRDLDTQQDLEARLDG